MSDSVIFRVLLIFIIIVVTFALVVQYNKSKQPESFRQPTEEARRKYLDRTGAEKWRGTEPFGDAVTNLSPPPASVPNAPAPAAVLHAPAPAPRSPSPSASKKAPTPFESLDTEMFQAISYDPAANAKPQPDPFPKGRMTSDDLLPKDAANSLWSKVNPAGQGDLKNVNLLDAGWNFGIDTQGQTLKNPNLQLRSEFPNPRKEVGPWGQSTIDNDCSHRYFEIGEH